MNYFILRCSLIYCAIVALTVAPSAHADVVYNVVPYTLSNGYAIAGGTITTNDAMDTVVAWDIEVTGALPYTFSHTNPGASVDATDFIISPTAIRVSGLAGIGLSTTGFFATDNTHPDCTDCRQDLVYISSGPSIYYSVFDDFDNTNQADGEFTYFATVIDVAVIPEPAMLALLGLGGLLITARRL